MLPFYSKIIKYKKIIFKNLILYKEYRLMELLNYREYNNKTVWSYVRTIIDRNFNF